MPIALNLKLRKYKYNMKSGIQKGAKSFFHENKLRTMSYDFKKSPKSRGIVCLLQWHSLVECEGIENDRTEKYL